LSIKPVFSGLRPFHRLQPTEDPRRVAKFLSLTQFLCYSTACHFAAFYYTVAKIDWPLANNKLWISILPRIMEPIRKQKLVEDMLRFPMLEIKS
jgi:hypothetical protein